MAVDRVDAGTLNSALDQILLLSGHLAQAHDIQFPVTVRANRRARKCFLAMEVTSNDDGGWKSRVLEMDIPKSGVGMPILVHLQGHDGQRVKALIQRRSRKTVPQELW